MTRIRRISIVFAALALGMALAGGTCWFSYRQFLEQPLSIDQTIVFELPAGTSYAGMVNRLRAIGVTDVRWPWRLHGWISADVARLKAGEYRLQPGMTPRQWLQRLVNGEVVQYSFTIVEGWTFEYLRSKIQELPALTQTLADVDPTAVMERLGQSGQHPEGWFLPETYLYTRGTTDFELLQRANRAMQKALAQAWQQRLGELPLENAYEALVLASIIEKETARADERATIAGVFVRRLRRNMRLQTDPTVIYGLGNEFDGDIRRRDLRADTPYNTYTRHGLPPTPIALPSMASLLAAVLPEPGDALYFVARGDGSHQFSATLEEHNRAVDRYQRGLP